MKKLIKAVLCLSIMFTIAACNGDEADETDEADEVTELEGVARAEIILSQEYQTMIGFGASYSWYSDMALRHPERKEEIADLLFKDAKMTILRFKNDYMYNGISAISEKAKEVEFYNMAKERAAKYNEGVTVLMSTWSPPAYLKSNDSVNGGGTIKKNQDGEYMYDEFAEWWVDSVEAYRNAGVAVDYISIQNECDFTAGYDGMELAKFENENEAEYGKAFLGTYYKMQERLGSNAPLMLGPETMSFNANDLKLYLKPVLDAAPQSLAGVAFHMYVGGSSIGEGGESNGPGRSTNQPDEFNRNFFDNYAEFGGKFPLWQTEFYRGRPMQTAILMNNALIYGNLNAYLHWTGVWNRNFPSHDLIGVNGKGEYFVGSSYYVMRHFSEFIRPGYIRTQVNFSQSDGFKVSAFKSPDESKIAVVLINPTYEDIEIAIPIEGFKITDSAVYQTVLEEDGYESEEYYVNIGSLGRANTVLLKAFSITTVDLTGE